MNTTPGPAQKQDALIDEKAAALEAQLFITMQEYLANPAEGVAPISAEEFTTFLKYTEQARRADRTAIVPNNINDISARIMHDHLKLTGYNSHIQTSKQALQVLALLKYFVFHENDWRDAKQRNHVLNQKIPQLNDTAHLELKSFVANSRKSNQESPANNPPILPDNSTAGHTAGDNIFVVRPGKPHRATKTVSENARPPASTPPSAQPVPHYIPAPAIIGLREGWFDMFLKNFRLGHLEKDGGYVSQLMGCVDLVLAGASPGTVPQIDRMIAITILAVDRKIEPAEFETKFNPMLTQKQYDRDFWRTAREYLDEQILTDVLQINQRHASRWCGARYNWDHFVAGAFQHAYALIPDKPKSGVGALWPTAPRYMQPIPPVFNEYLQLPDAQALRGGKRATVMPDASKIRHPR